MILFATVLVGLTSLCHASVSHIAHSFRANVSDHSSFLWIDDFNDFDTMVPTIVSPLGRSFHASCALGDKFSMLMTGGLSSNGLYGEVWQPQKDTWVYNMETFTWAQKSDMPTKLYGHTCVVMVNATTLVETVFVFGGTGVSVASGSLYAFIVSTGTWVVIAPVSTSFTPVPRGSHVAVVYGGKMLVHGGIAANFSVLSDTWLYDPQANLWVTLETGSTGPYLAGHIGFSFAVPQQVFLTGGCHRALEPPTFAHFYSCGIVSMTYQLVVIAPAGPNNQSQYEWFALNNLPEHPGVADASVIVTTANSALGVAAVVYGGGSVLKMNSEVWVFTVEAQNWTLLPSHVPLASPRSPTASHTAVFNEASDTMVVFGGWSSVLAVTAALQLEPVIPSPGARSRHSAASLDAGLFIFGGLTIDGPQNDLWVVQPDLAQNFTGNILWAQVFAQNTSEAPSARYGHTLTKLSDNALVVIGGHEGVFANYLFLNDVWIAPINTIAPNVVGWVPASLNSSSGPTPRAFHAAATYLGDIFIYGGFGSSQVALADLWLFNMTTVSWHPVGLASAVPPLALYGHTAAVLLLDALPIFVVYGGAESAATNATADVLAFVFDAVTGNASVAVLQPVSDYNGLTVPPPRMFHSMTGAGSDIFSARSVLVHGGLSGSERLPTSFLGDTWEGSLISSTQWRWRLIPTTSNLMPRFGHIGQFLYRQSQYYFVVFGGVTDSISGLPSGAVDALRYGCNPGWFYSENLFQCLPCAVGTYSVIAGLLSCSPCSNGTTTNSTGAMHRYLCGECVPDWCHYHGHCSVVVANLEAVCLCDALWMGTRCETSVFKKYAPYVGGGVVLLVVLGTALACAVYHRRRVGRLQEYQLLQDGEHQKLQKEIHTLSSAFELQPDDVALHELIDEGGNGEVWRGTLFGDRTVAVKRLRTQMRVDEDHVAEFKNEVEFLRTLRHPQIVYFFGFGLMHDSPFFVTEYMSRGSLRRVLDEINVAYLPWSRRVSFALDGAKGMKFLHAKDLIHRQVLVDTRKRLVNL